MIERAVSQVLGRNTATSSMDEPLIHAVGAQKQCGIFCDTLPKSRVDHHKVTVDNPALLAAIVPEISSVFFLTWADTDIAGRVIALDRVLEVDHRLPPSDLLCGQRGGPG